MSPFGQVYPLPYTQICISSMYYQAQRRFSSRSSNGGLSSAASRGSLGVGVLNPRIVVLAISISAVLSGCFSAPEFQPENKPDISSPSVETDAPANGREVNGTPTRSCEALKDLSLALSGEGGFLDEENFLAWVIGLKNRFSHDEPNSMSEDLDSFRILFGRLSESVISYSPSLENGDSEKIISVVDNLNGNLESVAVSLNSLSAKCNDYFGLPAFEVETLRLGDFWKFGYWSFDRYENSLGEVTLNAMNWSQAGPYLIGLSLVCADWTSPPVTLLQIGAHVNNVDVDVADPGVGGIKVRLDDQSIQVWRGDFSNGMFFIFSDERSHTNLSEFKGVSNFAIQLKIAGKISDSSFDITGIDHVLELYREIGCIS